MLDFMDYVQNAFHEASHWNRNNSYGTLTATSQGPLPLPVLFLLALAIPITHLLSPPRLPHPPRPPSPHLLPLNPPLRLLLLPRLHRPPLRLPLLPLHLPPTPLSSIRNTLPPSSRLHTNIVPAAPPPSPPRAALVVGNMACWKTH